MYVCVYMYMYVCVYMYICMYICICVYVYAQTIHCNLPMTLIIKSCVKVNILKGCISDGKSRLRYTMWSHFRKFGAILTILWGKDQRSVGFT